MTFFWGVRPDSQTVRQTGTVAVAVIRMRRGNKGDPRRYRKGGWLKGEGIREQGEEFCPEEKMEGVFYLLLFFWSDFLESTSLKRFLKGGHSRRIVFPLLENTPRLDPRVGPLFFANVRLESILADDFCLWYDLSSVSERGGREKIDQWSAVSAVIWDWMWLLFRKTYCLCRCNMG